MIQPRSRQSLRQAFAFALEGLRYALRTQRTFRLHLVISAGIGALLLWLPLSALESGVIILAILVVLVVELVNTGVEVVVDLLVDRNHHALAKVAKDVAAAAVVVAAAGAAVVAVLVLGPPLATALGVDAGTAARWSRIGAVLAVLAGAAALLWLAQKPGGVVRSASSGRP